MNLGPCNLIMEPFNVIMGLRNEIMGRVEFELETVECE